MIINILDMIPSLITGWLIHSHTSTHSFVFTVAGAAGSNSKYWFSQPLSWSSVTSSRHSASLCPPVLWAVCASLLCRWHLKKKGLSMCDPNTAGCCWSADTFDRKDEKTCNSSDMVCVYRAVLDHWQKCWDLSVFSSIQWEINTDIAAGIDELLECVLLEKLLVIKLESEAQSDDTKIKHAKFTSLFIADSPKKPWNTWYSMFKVNKENESCSDEVSKHDRNICPMFSSLAGLI